MTHDETLETGEREGVDGALARTLTQPSAATDLTEGREGCDKGGQDTQKLSERTRNVMRNISYPAKCGVRGSLDRVSCRQTEKAVAKADKTLRNCQNAEET